ncbi:MAG: hypothetical protein AAGJ52_03570 [Pseudomonadota bacterium]
MLPDRQTESRTRTLPQLDWLRVLCLADQSGRIDADWLKRTRDRLPGAAFFSVAGSSDAADLNAWPGTLIGFDPVDGLSGVLPESDGLLMLRSGLDLSSLLAERLQALPAQVPGGQALVLPGNYHSELNPLAGLALADQAIDPHSLTAGAGTGLAVPCRAPEGSLIFVPPGPRPNDARLEMVVVDDLYLLDPERALDAG